MGIQVFPQSGFDPTKYRPYSNLNGLTTADTNWHTVLNITGKGFIKRAMALTGASCRITIDSVVYIFNAGIGGFLPDDELSTYYFSSATYNGYRAPGNDGTVTSSLQSLATTFNPAGQTTPGIILLASPIYFKQSLLVEVIAPDSTSQALKYDILGGIM